MRRNYALGIGALALILTLMAASCSLFAGGSSDSVKVESLSFSKTTLSLGIGGIEYLQLTIKPADAKKNAKVSYSYDDTVISVEADSSGATVSGLRNGSTVLLAKAGKHSAACVIEVTGIDPVAERAPYISTTTPVVEIEAGTTKKIIVSLSQGSSSEMSRFNWSIDKSSIATVEASGQNGVITARQNGVARITVTHPTCTYPLEVLVFVKPDNEKAVYLTTSQNIISLVRDGAKKNISVSLVNGEDAGQNGFTWEVINSAESSPSVISLMANGTNAEISPMQDGRAVIRVSHPKAMYPLDIKVRVVTLIENVYIDAASTRVAVSGTIPTNFSVSLKGSNRVNEANPADFIWSIENPDLCDISAYQNEVVITGKRNGITKLYVSHPAAKYPKEVMVFVQDQTEGAVHTGAYITTTQNYIRTKVGMDETELLATLIGGDPGDEANFVWSVDNPEIISLRTTNGTTGIKANRSMKFSIMQKRVDGTAYIEPLKEGTAVIYLSHPKILTPTEVLVKVYPEYASFEEPLVIQGESIIGLVRGTNFTTTVHLQGNATAADEAGLSWKSENNSVVTVSGSGKEQLITATGNGQTFVVIEHPRAANPKKILCYVAETAEELEAMRILYSEKTYYNLVAGTTAHIYLSGLNITSEEMDTVQWKTSNPAVATISRGDGSGVGEISAIASGTATITASVSGVVPVQFNVTVYPEGTDLGVLPPAIYFTTGQNVVQFTDLNANKTVSVTPVCLPLADYSGITWISDHPEIVEVIPNGSTATFTSKANGEAKVTVSHPKSENTLTITVRVGEEYIIVNPKAPFITASKDVVGLVAGSQGEQISAKLENGTQNTLFTWEIDDTTVATISPLGDKCFIVPKNPGQARLTIRHADATYDKSVLVLVGNTLADIEGIPFLTTSQNVVRMVTGTQQTISIRLSGIEGSSAADYSWNVDNPSIIRIVDNGNTAVITGLKEGVARLAISHTGCTYPLEITVIVSDTALDAANSPYITTNQNILSITKGSSSKSLSVTLAGGQESDNADFAWSVDRTDIIQLTANGQNAVVKGLDVGECRILVSHPKAQYPFPIVVMVEEPAPASNLYINPSLPIVSMKPADAAQNVSATLVGGTAEDKYGFVWSADNYNVIDLTYSANTAIITPRQEGKAEITISHPKAPYDAKIVVRVTEYSQFAFSQSSMTIPEGTTQFVSMQVPAIEGEYSGRVTYQTDNAKIVTITGTNKVAQLTALASGTAIVTATSPSGAKSELMVYVKKAAEMSAPYITSTTNVLSMKTTDSQRSITASIVGEGITTPDQYNLQWSVADPAIASLIGTSGSTVIVKPLKAGETTIKVTHPKTDTIFTIHVFVEGSVTGISLNRSYISTETGKTQELTATIDHGTSADYQKINWSADKINGEDIISLLGSGKTVAIYALKSGQTSVTAEFNGKVAKCEVLVTASRQLSFDTQSMRLQPGQTKTFKYVLVPTDATINWMTNTNDYISYTVDTDTKTVTVTGISDGSSSGSTTKLTGTANGMVASINITCAWDYNFALQKPSITAEPRPYPEDPSKFIIKYNVNPPNAKISYLLNESIAQVNVDTGKREIYVTPTKEGTAVLTVKATNPYNNYQFASQTCNLNLKYTSHTLGVSMTSRNGNYSRYEKANNRIVLGDGEEVVIKLFVEQANAEVEMSDGVYSKVSDKSPDVTYGKLGEGQYRLTHPTDVLDQEYKIIKAYMPVHYLQRTSSGTGSNITYTYSNPVTITNWKTDIVWWTDVDMRGSKEEDYVGLGSLTYSKKDIDANVLCIQPDEAINKWIAWKDEDGFNLRSNWWTKVENLAERGKTYSISEFQKIPWYYCPGISSHNASWAAGIMVENVEAVIQNVTSQAVIKFNKIGTFTVKLNGKEKTIEVCEEIRHCTKN